MNRSGFTLVEVMMAAAVVVVGVVGMMRAVTIGSEHLDTARKQQVAARLVQSELERLRQGPWSVVAGLPASATITIAANGAISGNTVSFALSNFTAPAGDDNVGLSRQGGGFTCTLAVTRLRPAGATAGTVTFVRLVYTVRWNSSTGRPHSRRTETYLGANGLHLSYQQT